MKLSETVFYLVWKENCNFTYEVVLLVRGKEAED